MSRNRLQKRKKVQERVDLLVGDANIEGKYCHTPSFAPRRQVAEPPSPSESDPAAKITAPPKLLKMGWRWLARGHGRAHEGTEGKDDDSYENT